MVSETIRTTATQLVTTMRFDIGFQIRDKKLSELQIHLRRVAAQLDREAAEGLIYPEEYDGFNVAQQELAARLHSIHSPEWWMKRADHSIGQLLTSMAHRIQ